MPFQPLKVQVSYLQCLGKMCQYLRLQTPVPRCQGLTQVTGSNVFDAVCIKIQDLQGLVSFQQLSQKFHTITDYVITEKEMHILIYFKVAKRMSL